MWADFLGHGLVVWAVVWAFRVGTVGRQPGDVFASHRRRCAAIPFVRAAAPLRRLPSRARRSPSRPSLSRALSFPPLSLARAFPPLPYTLRARSFLPYTARIPCFSCILLLAPLSPSHILLPSASLRRLPAGLRDELLLQRCVPFPPSLLPIPHSTARLLILRW